MDNTLPTFAHISGGRTSGFMAKLLKDEGVECEYLFQNTGRERPETYEFLKNLSDNFGIKITWLEYSAENGAKPIAKVVTQETADRNNKPFEQLLEKNNTLPNKFRRFCTIQMKVLTARRYIRSLGINEWNSLIGFRADEPDRVNSMQNRDVGKRVKEYKYAPLAERGLTIRDVMSFWKKQSFDLDLPMMPNGKTFGGNCMGCFWHSEYQNTMLCKTHPDAAQWMIDQEKKYGSTWENGVTWEEKREMALNNPQASFDMEDFYCMSTHGSCGQ